MKLQKKSKKSNKVLKDLEIFKASLCVCLFLFLFTGCVKKELIVKYKTYKFNEYIKLEKILFKPFKSNVSFKSKIIIKFSNGKTYKFYSIIYNKNKTHRIFAYTFFGKKIIDILFNKENYFTLGDKRELFIVLKNSVDKNTSLFYFFKEILDGIVVDKAQFVQGCIKGKYADFNILTCEKDNYKKVSFYKDNKLIRSFLIEKDKNGFPEKITLYQKGNTLEVIFKDFVENSNFKENFFKNVKKYKVYYVKNFKSVEENILR